MKHRLSQFMPHLLTLLLILFFWTVGLTNLDRFPKIHEDEAWQAAPGYTFWVEGRFGTDLFAGFYGMEKHYYGFMPLFPLLVGAALHLFGVGLFQARLVPLILITLTLVLTYRLGAKLFSPWSGALAVAVLVTWRIAGPFAHLVTGVPLADVARIVRYDSAVPVFGLLTLLTLTATLEKEKQQKLCQLLITNYQLLITFPLTAGLLTGLAALSHVYGAFWLPALLLAMVWLWGRRAIKPALITVVGFGLALTPWLIFVVSGWQDFLDQTRNYSDRFGLFDLRFYIINLLLESERYEPLFNGAKQSLGAWLWLIASGLGLMWLVGIAVGKPWSGNGPRSPVFGLRSPVVSARILVACLVTLGALFALLLSFKTFSYLATLWPLLALVIAAGFLHLWQASPRRSRLRQLLLGLFLLASLEGLLTTGRIHLTVRQNTPYRRYTQEIAARLPPTGQVMGMQHYWLGLAGDGHDYRSILTPIFRTNAKYVTSPVSFGQAADAIPPQIILLDQIMLDFLAETAAPTDKLHPLHREIKSYLRQRRARLIGELNDPTYGRMEIYLLAEKAGSSQ